MRRDSGQPWLKISTFLDKVASRKGLAMAMNIKNPEVELLVEEVAEMTGESKTEAVRRAG